MTISYKWLCEYVKTNLSPVKLAEIITAIGLEVEDIVEYESIKGALANVIIGQVLTVERIPDTERLKVTTVNTGADEPLQIVCGADNVAAGQKVIVATHGAVLYPSGSQEPLKIKKSKIRGVESNGMICAEDEIGLSSDHTGIMVLPPDTPIGIPAADYLGIYTDTLFEIGLTPNRNDAFSHIGVAREVAAYLNYHHPELMTALVIPSINLTTETAKNNNVNDISVNISNTILCPRYSGALLKNVTVGDSPAWLKNVLKAIGIQPINNIVDIVNYILNETGQPLHSFDADKIEGGQIYVRAAHANEPFVLLDGREIKLHTEDIIISDARKSLCMAGVYGGANSGITNQTHNVFIECAAFNMKYIRRSSMRHNLRTDAALHFEKGTDAHQIPYVLKRAINLITSIAGGELAGDIIDVNYLSNAVKDVTLTYKKIQDTIGVAIADHDIERILLSLGFSITNQNETGFTVRVPSYKLDVVLPADVIEEIIRIYGFENIPLATHVSFPPVTFKRTRDEWRNKLAQHLAAQGFNEVVNNSIVTSSRHKENEERQVRLLSYKNAGLDSLRTAMLPSLLDTLSYNYKRRISNARIFEFGRIFTHQNLSFSEEEQLCVALMGNMTDESWLNKPLAVADWKLLKPIVEQCLYISGTDSYTVKHSFNSITWYHNDVQLAELSFAQKDALQAADLKQNVWYAVINGDALFTLFENYSPVYKEPTKYPSIRRDIALLINKQVTFADIESIITTNAGRYLQRINVFDVYSGDKIEEGKLSYAVSLEFNNPTQSMQDNDVNKYTDKVKEALIKQLGAHIR